VSAHNLLLYRAYKKQGEPKIGCLQWRGFGISVGGQE
jgi:hypothetical protein